MNKSPAQIEANLRRAELTALCLEDDDDRAAAYDILTAQMDTNAEAMR